jgi:hypothetical protein
MKPISRAVRTWNGWACSGTSATGIIAAKSEILINGFSAGIKGLGDENREKSLNPLIPAHHFRS